MSRKLIPRGTSFSVWTDGQNDAMKPTVALFNLTKMPKNNRCFILGGFTNIIL